MAAHKNFVRCFLAAAILSGAPAQTALARPVPGPPPPMLRRVTNEPAWHGVRVAPPAGLKIRWRDKLNPVWWLQNADDPAPPDWYLPGEKHRVFKWSFRNPLHNFDFYVIGVADKDIVRSGRWPQKNFNPGGGWEFAVARRKSLVLPFVSYQRADCIFYIGWRERGDFGVELKFPRAVE
jgi:hypothetical protein